MQTPYKPVTGFGSKFPSPFGVSKKLFIGSDHLLIVEQLGCTEVYSRVKFKDIRYLAVRTKVPKFNILPLFTVAASCGLIAASFIGLPFGMCIGLLIGIGYIYWTRAMKGRCVCCLITDFQNVMLPVPNQLGQVSRFTEFLQKEGAPLNPKWSKE